VNTPVTTEEQAKQIACALLAKEQVPYEKYVGAVRTSTLDPRLWPEPDEDIWIVYFEPQSTLGVIRPLPHTIMVEIKPLTGEAKTFIHP
jgi:hypothetical protein